MVNKEDCEAYYNKGNLLKELGKVQEAPGCYEKAIELKADYCEPQHNSKLLRNSLERQKENLAKDDNLENSKETLDKEEEEEEMAHDAKRKSMIPFL